MHMVAWWCAGGRRAAALRAVLHAAVPRPPRRHGTGRASGGAAAGRCAGARCGARAGAARPCAGAAGVRKAHTALFGSNVVMASLAACAYRAMLWEMCYFALPRRVAAPGQPSRAMGGWLAWQPHISECAPGDAWTCATQELPHVVAGAARQSAGTADGVHGTTALANTVAATDAPHKDGPAGGPGALSAAADVRALALGLIRQLAGSMGDMAQLLEALGGVAARLPGTATPGNGPGGGQGSDALPTAALDCLLAAAGAAEAMPREVRGAPGPRHVQEQQ